MKCMLFKNAKQIFIYIIKIQIIRGITRKKYYTKVYFSHQVKKAGH